MGRREIDIDEDLVIDLDSVEYEEDGDYTNSLPGMPDEMDVHSVKVTAPSGAEYDVIGDREKEFYEEVVSRYMSDNKFTNVSDFQDLDRIILYELLSFRWGQWLLNKVDYFGMPIDEEETRKAINDASKENRLLKKALNLDKASRDKERGESVADYLETLKIRAREFGYMRNQQAVMAITLWKELQGIIQLNQNADEQERRELEANFQDIVNWLLDDAFPRFDEIDENFRATSQKYWVRNI